jgi:predicted ATPase
MIKQIRIQNFRSIVDQTVDLDPLTVLIGRSGTGKSNFVEAIRFLRDCLKSRQLKLNQSGGIHHVDHAKEPLRYEVKFSITGIEGEYHYLLSAKPQHGQIEEALRVGGTTLFHHADQKWLTAPAVVPTPPPNGILLGAIPGLQESAFAHVALSKGIGCYDFQGNVLGGVWNHSQGGDGASLDLGDNYLTVADRIHSDLTKAPHWKRIAKGMRAVNRSVANLTLNSPTPDRITVGLQLNGRVLSMDVRQESEGFRRYLAHLLALYQTPSKQTLIFEHPESGLHPGALESLAEEFKDCPEEGRGQVILTTHSPQLLHYFPVKSIRVVDIDHQQTRIGPLAPEQLKAVEEHLLLPDELLTVDPARLEGQLNEVPG